MNEEVSDEEFGHRLNVITIFLGTEWFREITPQTWEWTICNYAPSYSNSDVICAGAPLTSPKARRFEDFSKLWRRWVEREGQASW
jgi:hypothetical protein